VGIGVDSSGVYWVDSQDHSLMKGPLDGGSPTKLAGDWTTNTPPSIAVDGTGVYVAIDGAPPSGSTVVKVPLDGVARRGNSADAGDRADEARGHSIQRARACRGQTPLTAPS